MQLKWKKTGWFVPSEGKFIWKGYFVETSGAASLSMNKPNPMKPVPNIKYWFTLINNIGSEPEGRLTKYKSDNGYYVYYNSTTGLFIYNNDAKKVISFKGAPRVRKLFASNTNAERFINLPNSSPNNNSNSSSNNSNGKKKTKFFTSSGNSIYINNSQAYYKFAGKGTWIGLGPQGKLFDAPSGGKNVGFVSSLFSKNNNIVKTNFVTAAGKPIYVKNSKAFYKKPNGTNQELVSNAPIVHKNTKKLSGQVNNIFTNSKTSHKSTNGQNVYKFKNQYYIMKNGKAVLKFKGKAKLPPLTGTATVQVPVVKPAPSHVVAPRNARIAKLGLLLKAIVARKKKLAKEPTKTNYYTNYCQNFGKGYVADVRTNSLHFYFPQVKGFTDGTNTWKNSLTHVKWKHLSKSFNMSYANHNFAKHLVLKYYPPMKNFKNFDKSNIIDMTWYQKQNKWLQSLSPREIFLLYGYSHNGDVWAHAYLDNKFNMKMFIDKVKGITNYQYFALFFQAREFYKINTGNIQNDYPEVMKRVRAETNPDNIKSIIQMFINELNTLCSKAPVTTKPFVVWRGVKDDTYMTGMKDKQYTLNRFASTTVDADVAVQFGKSTGVHSHAVQRILIMPGSKCVLMFGTTRYSEEFEILLPRGSTYIIRKTEKDVEPLKTTSWICPGPSYPPQYNSSKHVNNLVDIILLGQSKKFLKSA